ncbi:MAG: helix-turn-helix transcriptional regulator [Acidimicrobiaceae bacterium]|nr:helix-turn-helix domain-containing protein [Acidimicrobiia bacterium]MCY4492377.1 helix-turn-helix transcriptional regulator [Acidimicrobiaceae bacterium]
MTSAERAEFEEALASARVAIRVGEMVREAREAAGVGQRELARRMSTSQAAVARLEAGGTRAKLTTLQKAATALGLELTIDLAPTH